jgi:hypothetical protein
MKDFAPIDWKQYNKPPFYQQWLCKGDPFKLATFGDQNLTDIVSQVLRLKDQWNLDSAKGVQLDRIGKLLNEKRNENDDEVYRLLLKLRPMLNTANGTINDIIKVIKFVCGGGIVHIVPDYPARLIIFHDGEAQGENFNEIIRQVVGAGIDCFTKELFYFTEELPPSEVVGMKAVNSMMDSMAYVLHNGVYRRNGQIRRRYTGVKDVLAISIGYALTDQLFGMAMRNGLFQRNSVITHSGFANDVATELWSFNGRINYEENAQSSEQTAVSLSYQLSEGVEQDFRHNGKFRRNGEVQHKTRYILDTINLKILAYMQEPVQGLAFRNGLFRRDGSIKHGLLLTSITEKSAVKLKHNLQDILTTEDEIKNVSLKHPLTETFHKGLRRNGRIRHNGRYNRATGVVGVQNIDIHVSPFTDTLACSESMAIGYRKHYKRNGRFIRNGTVKHDSNILHPLEN